MPRMPRGRGVTGGEIRLSDECLMNALRRIAPYGLMMTVALLTAFGIAMLYSTTAHMAAERLLTRQFIWIVGGVCGACAINLVGYRRLGRWSLWLLLAVAVPLCLLALGHALEIVLKKAGISSAWLGSIPIIGSGARGGAWRWLDFGPFTVQPSEFAKILLILFLAHYYSANPRYVDDWRRGLLRPLALVGGVLVVVLLGGSLSITAITGSVVLAMLFVAGIRLRYFLIFVVAGLALLLAVTYVSKERLGRLTTYRNPELYAKKGGYQLYHSQLALGSGSWRGVGFNRSTMKEYYLPEAHTDFILAIVGEELGYFGLLTVIVLYLLLMGFAFAIGITAADREGMLLGFGVGFSLGMHGFANLGVVSGLLPTTGVTAPLISYGGSSMLATWLGIGLLIGVARVASQPGEIQEVTIEPIHRDPVLVTYARPGSEQ